MERKYGAPLTRIQVRIINQLCFYREKKKQSICILNLTGNPVISPKGSS